MNITIITPTYNPGVLLSETANSIAHHNDSIHHIIIDNMSKSLPLKDLERLSSKYPNYSYAIFKIKSTIYEAMNHGITQVDTGIIGIINSGDKLLIKPSEISDCFMWNSLDFLHGNSILIRNDSKIPVAISKPPLPFRNIDSIRYDFQMPIVHCTLFCTLDAYKLIGLYDCRYSLSAVY